MKGLEIKAVNRLNDTTCFSEDSAAVCTQWFTAEACFDDTPLKNGWLLTTLRKTRNTLVSSECALLETLPVDHLAAQSAPAHCGAFARITETKSRSWEKKISFCRRPLSPRPYLNNRKCVVTVAAAIIAAVQPREPRGCPWGIA